MGAVRGIAVDGLESGATKAELAQTQVDCDVFWFSRVETGKHPEARGERREAGGGIEPGMEPSTAVQVFESRAVLRATPDPGNAAPRGTRQCHVVVTVSSDGVVCKTTSGAAARERATLTIDRHIRLPSSAMLLTGR
jgi:hypothetical protein